MALMLVMAIVVVMVAFGRQTSPLRQLEVSVTGKQNSSRKQRSPFPCGVCVQWQNMNMQTRTQPVSFSVAWLTPEGFSVAQRWL